MQQKSSGFTLIELMMVIAIIGLLASIAVPMYKDYVLRAQVAEGMALIQRLKLNLIEMYSSDGAFPTLEKFKKVVGETIVPDPVFIKYKLSDKWSYDCYGGFDSNICHQLQIWANTNTKAMSGFIEEVYGTESAIIMIRATVTNGKLDFTCGYNANSPVASINPKLLPKSCNTAITSIDPPV